MSDFWARRLNMPTQPTAPAATPISTAWWATPLTPQPAPQPVQQVQAAHPETIADALAGNGPAPVKAQSARSTATCPDCGSGNYFKPQGSPNAMEQCYECGANPRFSHTTAGIHIPSDAGAPTPAKQINPGVNNFNPQQVIAHI